MAYINVDLLRRAGPPGPDGATIRIEPRAEPADPGGTGWRWIEFSAHRLTDGQSVLRAGDEREVGLVVLEGTVDIDADGRSFGAVGSRASVFAAEPAPVVLVAPGASLAVTARGPATIAIAGAKGGDLRETRLIEPGTIRIEARGSGATARTIRHLLPPEAAAGRLILVEVLTPGGNWSSYPPHKHDTEDQPRESQLEELYYYRFARPEGFAFARVYTADRSLDEAMTPGDGDVVLVPRGYHPVGAPAGYDCYYLNVMAGPTRLWHFTVDPDHAWLMDWDPRPAEPGPGERARAERTVALAILTEAEQHFLAAARRAVLVTSDAAGRPRPVPICFALIGDGEPPTVYSPLDEKPKRDADPHRLARVADIAARPDVVVLVDRWDEDWTRLGWLRCQAGAVLIEPEASDASADDVADARAERVAAIAALRAKYRQYADHDLASRPLIRLVVTAATSWGDLDPDV